MPTRVFYKREGYAATRISRKRVNMDSAMRFSLAVSMIVLPIAASCSRRPQESVGTPSAQHRDADVKGNSIIQLAGSSGIGESFTANSVSVPHETVSSQCDVDTDIVEMAIDIMSGDLRRTRSSSDGITQYEVYESELSKEVRRLGIPIPEERQWRVIARPASRGLRIRYVYEDALLIAQRLLMLLDDVGASDEERRATIERFMNNIRTEKPSTAFKNGHMLILEISNRHGWESPFTPEHTENLQRSQQR